MSVITNCYGLYRRFTASVLIFVTSLHSSVYSCLLSSSHIDKTSLQMSRAITLEAMFFPQQSQYTDVHMTFINVLLSLFIWILLTCLAIKSSTKWRHIWYLLMILIWMIYKKNGLTVIWKANRMSNKFVIICPEFINLKSNFSHNYVNKWCYSIQIISHREHTD